MLKDITIGQYYNTSSLIHALDPRTKIISLIVMMVLIFVLNSPVEYAVAIGLTGVMVLMSKVPIGFILKGLKPIWLLITFTAVINLLLGTGEEVLFKWQFITITKEALYLAIVMMIRVVLLVVLSSLLTLTTPAMNLTTGIERLLRPLEVIKFPSHEVAMMMSIALRFIPTLTNEAEKIMKAQASRGNDFESGGIIKKAMAMVPLFIPLFISAFRRADELAMAMECRCYRGGKGRTDYKVLKYRICDLVAFIFVLALTIAVVCIRIV